MSGDQKFYNSIPNMCLRFFLLLYRAWFQVQTFFLTAGGVVEDMILGHRLWNFQVSLAGLKHRVAKTGMPYKSSVVWPLLNATNHSENGLT